MVAIEYEHIVGPCIITAISSYQHANFARKVERARKKYKITALETTEEEGFLRIVRAQQNSTEFYPVFLANIWSSSLLFHQGPSVALGLIYIVARSIYFRAYSETAYVDEKRTPGYKLSMLALLGMSGFSLLGIGNLLIIKFTGKSLNRLLN